jgi:hypothetical protein
VTVILALVLLFEVLPYLEELVRGLRRCGMPYTLAPRLVPAGRGSGLRANAEKEQSP